MELLSNTYFALFLIIAIGFIIGSVKIKGISLDMSAVIFVALFFGHFGVIIPKDIQLIGLVLFIFTIGLQSGPGFFNSFLKEGKTLSVLVILLIVSGTLLSFLASRLFHLDKNLTTGLFTGALTSTPGLAAATEASKSPIASIGYGIAYPFGVLGVILFIKLVPVLFKIDLRKAELELRNKHKEAYPEIHYKHYEISNVNVIGHSLGELKLRTMTGASISRVKKGDFSFTPEPGTILEKGDVVRAVGTDEALMKIQTVLGELSEQEITLSENYQIKSLLVTNKEVINKTIQQLNLFVTYNAVITRVRRSGIDLQPNPDLHLRLGDKLLIACNKDDMNQVAKLVGNNDKVLSDTNLFPIAAGIILGILVSKLSINYGDFTFSLGLTGGILITSLILGKVGKTGPVVWTMTGNSNQLLRQLGLLLFMSSVGTIAGSKLIETFVEYGWQLFLIGAAITLLPMFITFFVAYYGLKINIFTLLGAISGGMTSTPGLAAVDSMGETNEASVAYATVYPISMVLLIICVQILVFI